MYWIKTLELSGSTISSLQQFHGR